ncbi:hypothetical protein F0562_029513 [Nyssa sinensis]|uniref:RING-type domain-containing protein n=1 Tax=Nyssa sinensis TaxID=561372 RepID=A0A5J5B183_9ASTE|nr:hypothetical protein F0562_029513 [Nyssa sinensis]
MASQVVKVRTETLAALITCPLCNKILKDATTISLCLHTFCRKCIYEKLSDEEVDSCPVCNIDLGCVPVEKLRPDHNLQDIRVKIFPFRRRKIKGTEVVPSISLPVKRKERSLSSLVSTPKVSMQTGLTGRRTKSVARKAASCSSPSEPFHNRAPKRDMENAEALEGNVDLWKPLNCLVEAANRTKCLKLNSQDSSPAKLEPLNAPDCEVHVPKTRVKERQHKSKVQDDKNGPTLLLGQVKRRRLRAVGRKRAARGLCASEQAMLDSMGAKQNRRNCPIWFSLVASEDQKEDIHLPQISAFYLRIKDGNLPVSFIQKYLVKKLDLTSEAEVEIMCQGQPVLPTLQLRKLVDLWLQAAST